MALGGTNPLFLKKAAAAAPSGDVVTKSLRVEDDAYISFTPSTATTTRTKAVINFWFKLAEPVGPTRYCHMFTAGVVQGSGTVWFGILYTAATGTIKISNEMGVSGGVTTNAVFRDYGAWHNLHLIADTTAAETDRWKLYINGVLQTLTGTFPTLNLNLRIGDNKPHRFSYQDNPGYHGTTFGPQMYIANAYLLENSTLPYTTFVEEDATTGQLKPKATSGLTFGTNGFHLDFEDSSSSSTIGNDVSGNDNDFAATNLSTWDIVNDTPTENYAVLNVLASTSAGTASATASEGNLQLTWSSGGGSTYFLPSTIGFSSGKFYYEAYINNTYGAGANVGIGVANESANPNASLGGDTNSLYYEVGGDVYYDSTSVSYGGSWTTGAVLGVAVDADTGKVWYSVGGTWQGSPTAGTGEAVTLSGNTFFAAFRAYAYEFTANFGQDPFFAGGKTSGQDTSQSEFYYEPPSGFSALSTANLPIPTIKKPAAHFNTVLYTGDNTTGRDIEGVGFRPDFTWLKNRSGTNWHTLFDSVRGTSFLWANSEVAEGSDGPAFIDDGITVDHNASSGNNNASGTNYVIWNWLAEDEFEAEDGVSDSGSKNVDAGFSIASWTGDDDGMDMSGNPQPQTINHGLGVVPEMIIAKERESGSGTGDWAVWHTDLSSGKYLVLNDTAGEESWTDALFSNIDATSVDVKNDSLSSGIYLNDGMGPNTYVAYFFASKAGYSLVGSYTGNGSADGPFVYCGFRPAYIMVKNTSSSNWLTHDSKRDAYNPTLADLFPNTSGAEETGNGIYVDFLSNGFKTRETSAVTNTSGQKYIFYAVAESPLKYASAR